jgi:hypothetical protein
LSTDVSEVRAAFIIRDHSSQKTILNNKVRDFKRMHLGFYRNDINTFV